MSEPSHLAVLRPKGRYPIIPLIVEGAMQHSMPQKAQPEHMAELGFPSELPADWKDTVLSRMGELLQQRRGLRVFMDSCTRCGACTDKCHYFLGTADPKNMPVARQDLMRNVYRRYFTFAGRYFPKLVGAVDLTEEVLEDWYRYYHQCSECRRCTVYCPKGIDTSEVTMAGRELLSSVGIGQHYATEIIGKVHKTGNNLGLKSTALLNTLEMLEEDLLEDTGGHIKLPLDVKGADILLVLPSADFFAEPHIDGFLGVAKVFHQAGLSWTLSSTALEAANFGLFTGSDEHMRKIADRVYVASRELAVKRIVVGECGHAWRVACNFWPQWFHDVSFLDERYPLPQHVCEVSYDLLKQGALTIDKSLNADKRVTYHDSCNVARASGMGNRPGGQFTIPRELIKASCEHFYDMRKDAIKQATFCCGGGGGLLTDDLKELRTKGALPRMQALQQVVEQHDVTHMVAICAICKTQFSQVLPDYGHARDGVMSLHQLLGDALVFENS